MTLPLISDDRPRNTRFAVISAKQMRVFNGRELIAEDNSGHAYTAEEVEEGRVHDYSKQAIGEST